ncbi:MAG: citrate lyase acyl carrier protein [Oscillospiraceae bacterium]|nr:citrate lyase acyl carrier protein [Oscillospiraceae bacterium]
MKLKVPSTAGTMESNDVLVSIKPAKSGGIQIALQSNVMQQYGRRIREVITETLEELGVENAEVEATDKGALDCTIRARVAAAAYRAAESSDYHWEAKK